MNISFFRLLLIVWLILPTISYSQRNRVTIRGNVTDMKGEHITGANILEKNSSNNTTSGANGNFSLDVSGEDSELIITYSGYKPQSVPVNGRTNLTIRMEIEALAYETVVVTAMGIKKKEASLTYSTQQFEGDELTRIKDTNLMNTLAGKSAGVQINRSTSGLGGSVKVTIRGARSISGNNQPLYVIDGMPMLNNSSEQASTIMGSLTDGANRDAGDGISNLNPDDIETISILKGASAAALYGSQASNGVVMINTKRGRPGIQRATFSTSTTFDKAVSLPKFQNSYGIDDEKTSWGEKQALKKYDNVGDYFRGGVTTINSVTLSRGHETVQTYFSYANTYGKGIIEGNNLNKHNLNLRETALCFNNRLTLDGNINLIHQTLNNRPTTGGLYINPLVGLYTFARGEDISPYRNEFETYSIERNMNVQSWYRNIVGVEQNPYWILNRVIGKDKRIRAMVNLSANLKVNNWLTIQARGSADYINDKYTQKMYASTAPDIAGNNGRYIDFKNEELLIYADAMAMFNKSWYDWSLTGAVGTSINRTTTNSTRIDSRTASLYYPNQFSVANIVVNTNAYLNEEIDQKRETQSLFTTAQLGWKESLYLDITARNDWSSTLAYTSKDSFFYPSIGASWILNNTVRLPSWISFGKVRASWSQVGNDIPPFYSRLEDRVVAGGGIQVNDRAPFTELKPELSTSIEFGTEWRMFNQRLEIDLTYYKTDTKNQLLTLPSKAGALYKFYMVNAGKISNRGFEAIISSTPIMNNLFRWKTTVNFSTNKNKVERLHPELNSFIYGIEGFSMNYVMRLKEGGSFGDIYGCKFVRDEEGKIQTDSNGIPIPVNQKNTEKVGNCNPDYLLGWGNTLTYKGFSLYFLIDSRVGGDVLSMTQAELDYRGVSKASGQARDRGYVEVNGQKFENVSGFYKLVGSQSNCVTEYYMYSATNIRLRELAISYSIPRPLIEKMKVFSSIDLSLIGRNLFFLHKDAPFDPDAVMSTENSCQGVDAFNTPSTRSIGFSAKFTF